MENEINNSTINKTKKNFLFITTVGTSIITKYEVKNNPIVLIEKRDKNLLKHQDKNLEDIDDVNKLKDLINHKYKDKKEEDISHLCTTEVFFEGRLDIEELAEYSAELSTMNNFVSKYKQINYKVILIPTLTASSLCCALLIKEYLDTNGIDCKIECVKYLSFPDSETFSTKGLVEFLKKVFELTQQGLEEGYEVILNPTGGYKSLFPLVTIVGILLKCKVIYKYEESEKIIEIPPLPLSIDIYKWYRELEKIEVYKGKDYKTSVKNISKDFHPLLEEKDNLLQTNVLYDFFKSQLQQLNRRFNPLFLKSRSTTLLDRLNGFEKKIQTLSDIVHLIWKGDRVPEMVDHGMRHHTNLIMIAERILLPIFDNNIIDLSPEELFTLLCTIYFHDCGHVIGKIEVNNEKILLFPDEIRDFHHILGFERLKNYNNPSYFSKTIYEYLSENWQEPDFDTLWNNYLKAPAYVGLYHRKAMPLLKDQQPYKKHVYLFANDGYKPLYEISNDEKFMINNKEIKRDRLLLICALFRIIDSLDVQIARSGDEYEIEFHKEQLQNEIEEEKIRAERYFNIIYNDTKKVAEMLESKLPLDISSKTQKIKIKSEELRNLLKEIEADFKSVYYYAEEYIRSVLRLRFKEKQVDHFIKHSSIEQVIIKHEIQNGNILFNVSLKVRDELKNNEKIMNLLKETIQELREEYYTEDNPAVREILKQNGIEVRYMED